MQFVKHKSSNYTFIAPEGMKDRCVDLPVTVCTLNGDPAIKSYWKPSEQDIANILAGGHVCLYVVGNGMPPVLLTVECQ